MDEDNVKRIMRQVKSFPGMPTTAAKLLPLLREPDAGASQIEEILKYDPGLTANILKLTNSAYFGLPARVSSVHQAILLIGRKRLLQLVITMCMSGLMKKSVPGYDLPQGGLWRHSVAVAVAADLLVQSLCIPRVDEAFTAALLHDIGKMVLGEYVQEDLQTIEEMVAKGISFEVAEYVVLGTNHADIGARILKNWSMPPELVDAVAWHHDPERCQTRCLISDVVHTANIAVRRIGFGKRRNDPSPDPSCEVIDRLGLSADRLAVLSEHTLREMEKLTEVLNA